MAASPMPRWRRARGGAGTEQVAPPPHGRVTLDKSLPPLCLSFFICDTAL